MKPPQAKPFRTAHPTAASIASGGKRLNHQIRPAVSMAVGAVGLGGVLGGKRHAAQHVHVVGDRLKMIRVYAGRDATQVIQFGRQAADNHAVRKAMRSHLPRLATKIEGAVTTRHYAPTPEPTGIREFNLSPEPNSSSGNHVTSIPQMHTRAWRRGELDE